jgi:hypothetical protein
LVLCSVAARSDNIASAFRFTLLCAVKPGVDRPMAARQARRHRAEPKAYKSIVPDRFFSSRHGFLTRSMTF